jgi:uncharacterized protein (TIGR03118 family)
MSSRSPVPVGRRGGVCYALATLLAMFTMCSVASAQYYPPPSPPPPPAPPDPVPPSPQSTFSITPIVSNGSVAGTITDPDLVNPWALAVAPGGPIWVANNGTQTATAYDGAGNRQLVVSLPGSARGPAGVTGMVFNGTTDFVISNGVASAPAQFIFDGEGGTLLAWSESIDPANATIVYEDGAGGAVYKGLTIASNGTANLLYAADFHNGKVDVFDAQFQKTIVSGGFIDPQLPLGYAPFGIQAVQLGEGTLIVVTYAQHAPDNLDEDVKGPGLGLVNVFDANGTLLRHLVGVGLQLNAPWGVALAPASFGSLSNMLLIGNFGDGVIHAYDPNSGTFVDTIKDPSGQPIAIEGLWGLLFGNDANGQPASTLFFAAGIAAETAGLYGRIDLQQ